MSDLNRRIENFKEEAQNKTNQVQDKLVLKSKECEELSREKADLEAKLKSISDNLAIIDSDAQNNENTQAGKEREIFESIEEASKQLTFYKEKVNQQKEEVEKCTLKCNKAESDLKMVLIDYEREKDSNSSLNKEVNELKKRIEDLEKLKKDYISNLGTSKLNMSNLNFSKFFQNDILQVKKEESPSFGGGGGIPEVEERDSEVYDSKKPEEILFLSKKDAPAQAAASSKDTTKKDGPLGVTPLNLGSFGEPPSKTGEKQVDFLGVRDTPRFELDIPNRETSSKNPYLDRLSSMRPGAGIGSIVRVRESRMSNLVGALGQNRTNDYSTMQDYMNVCGASEVSDKLHDIGDWTLNPTRCFSDSVFLFNKKLIKVRVIMIITSHSISFFNTKKTKLMKFITLKMLKNATISADNYTLMLFNFTNNPDLLVESYRRFELLTFLNHIFSIEKIPKFNFTIRKKFILKVDEDKPEQKIEVGNPDSKLSHAFLQETIHNSLKSGYLSKPRKAWFGRTVDEEYFCLLTNIGIIMFRKYGVDLGLRRTRNLPSFNRFLGPLWCLLKKLLRRRAESLP